MPSAGFLTTIATLDGTRYTVVFWEYVTTSPNKIVHGYPTKTSILDGTVWIKPTPTPSTRTSAISATDPASLRDATPASAKTVTGKQTLTSSSGALSTPAEAGIGVGVGLVALLAAGLLLFYFSRKRKRRAKPLEIDTSDEGDAAVEKGNMFGENSPSRYATQLRKNGLGVDTTHAELDGTERRKVELSDERSPTELDAAVCNPREIHEAPETHEQDETENGRTKSKVEITTAPKPPPIPYASKPKQVTVSNYDYETKSKRA